MARFLNVVDVSEAVAASIAIAPNPVPETVPLEDAAGRVLSADIFAGEDIPGFDRSVVDGFALRAEDTTSSTESAPALFHCTGRILMGTGESRFPVSKGTCVYLPTGGVMPAGADAIVMTEYTEQIGDTVLVKRSVAYGENLLRKDEDFRKGALVLPKGRRLNPQDSGVLAACGKTEVMVAKKPIVGIISSGNELVEISATPGPGQVRDANASMLAAWLREYGCVPRLFGIVRDERESFDAALSMALTECDVVLLSGGSSKDDRDMTAGVIADLGSVLVHGVAIAPGKPTIIGKIGEKPVFGLPGHPASAYVVLTVIVRPLLDHMLGASKPFVRITPATLGDNLPSQKGREEYVRVRLEDGIAYPVFGKSGLLNTLVNSDGLVRIPANAEGMEAGTRIEVILW